VKVRVLWCSGAIAKVCRTTAFLLGSSVPIDAGTGNGELSFNEKQGIDYVFLNHSHLDRIAAPTVTQDAVGTKRNRLVSVNAIPTTISTLKKYMFKGFWPDFS
jgi:phosphoribosyl 1,2-cyclic phosphodiesterase